jgi:hypothetical protein
MQMENCVDERQNIGKTSCTVMPELPKCMLTVPDNFEATETEIADIAFWMAALIAPKTSRAYLFPDFVDFKDSSDKATYEKTPLADMAVWPGKFVFDIAIRKDLCTHRALSTHKQNSGRVIIWDSENQFIMTKKSNGKYTGLKIALLNPEKLMFNDGKNASKSPVHLVLADHKELDQNGYAFDVSSFVNELMPLTDLNVAITKADAAAHKLYITVTASCDGTPVAGFLEADFSATKTSDGSAQALTGFHDNADGTYELDFGALVEGDLNMRAASLLTVPGYELPAVVHFIPA